ncbi:unnamed protein product [Dibothriocephalus latus]|uniref:LNR domain-containing protein n=1 Tax=Dibothriocephalus latus TaxID=60516 RepID=A0A3P7N452_DIBLA|nr:unnamed protein product [Dibothriocephalus latus]
MSRMMNPRRMSKRQANKNIVSAMELSSSQLLAGTHQREGSTCDHGYFSCSDYDQGCYPIDYLCDGVENCANGSDEYGC